MSYLGVSPGFSQFDRDNMARWWFAGYANWTKALIAAIEGSGSTDQRSQNAVGDAKASVWKATKFFEDWHYVEAATEARHAYGIAQTEATRLGVGESTANARVAPADPEPVPRRVDPIRFPTG
jgi:hypothetical protein